MKTTSEILQEALLLGKHLTKFDFLNLTNSVCLAQRVQELRQMGWNIVDKNVPGKGTLKEYWLMPEELERIKNSPRMVSNNEQNQKDEHLVEPMDKTMEKAYVIIKKEEHA